MGLYNVVWKRSAEKDLRSIDPRYVARIIEAAEALSLNPFPVQHRKLHGGEASYRLRVGDYRVVYQVDQPGGLVTIYHVRHRRDVYRK